MARPKSATNEVFDALVNLICSYEYAPGDKLPAENALAEEYGVSRVTIRAALNQLSALGLIESKVGGGWYVKQFNFSFITNTTSKFMITKVSENDIREYRALIEIASLENLRGKRILEADLKYLENCCTRMQPLTTMRNLRKIAIADYDFHRRICKMSGNRLYLYSYDMLYSLIVEFFEQQIVEVGKNYQINAEATIKSHREILSGIAAGDIDKAIKYTRMMTQGSVSDFISFYLGK